MNHYDIVYDNRALVDLKNIYDYHFGFSLKTADKFIDKVDNGILHLSEFPHLGKDNGKYRRIVLKPYIVYYTVDDQKQKVTIMYVRHSLQEQS